MRKTTYLFAAGLLSMAMFGSPAVAQQVSSWGTGYSGQLPRYSTGGYGHSTGHYWGPYGYGRTARAAINQYYGSSYGYGHGLPYYGYNYRVPRYATGGYGHSLGHYWGPYGYGRTARAAIIN